MSQPITAASAATSTPQQPRKRMMRRKKKQLTPKQKLVKESAEQRFQIEKLVFVWQEKLFSQAKTSPQTLQRATTYLQLKTFDEVVEERVVQEWCGYPLCDRQPKTQELQKYKISLSQRKVYDQTELANYCSEGCYHKSKYYIMQLSEEPVWFRDLNALPTAHIILLEEDFRTAVQQERKKTTLVKSNEDIRTEYVQHLLANVPKDTQGKFEIIEKSTVAPPSTVINETGVYDSIEGYRIEIRKDDKSPSTMILKKKKEEEIRKEQEEKRLLEEEKKKAEREAAEQGLDSDDPGALFETMMMLKDMNMDKEDQSPIEKAPVVDNEPKQVITQPKKPSEKKELKIVENASTSSTATTTSTSKDIKKDNKPISKPVSKEEVKTIKTEKKKLPQQEEHTNIIKVTTQKPKEEPAKKKKKKAVPELSLFGTIWTIVDHMTTKATRIYLSELQNNHQRVDVSALLTENDLVDEAMYLRGQIFSERILDTYGIIRTQLDIKERLEDDIVNIIKTFRLSDASMVALTPAQSYMMTLVLIKSLADILLDGSEWRNQFEMCCKTIDQSTDMVDACVRVLKIASV